MAVTSITLDDNVKRDATELLNSIGLSLSGYCTLALKQLINKRRVPFELEAAPLEPNEQTRRAMIEAEAKAYGLIPDDAPGYTDA